MIYHDYVTVLEDYDDEFIEEDIQSDEEESKHEVRCTKITQDCIDQVIEDETKIQKLNSTGLIKQKTVVFGDDVLPQRCKLTIYSESDYF